MIKSFDNYYFLGEVGANDCPGSHWEKRYGIDCARVFVPGRRPTRQDVIDAFKELEAHIKERD